MENETKKTISQMSEVEIRQETAKRFCEKLQIKEGSKRWAEIMARNINPTTKTV